MKKTLIYISLLLLAIILFIAWYIVSWVKYLPPHYHANFALFINWKKFDFAKDKYMEPVASCRTSWDIIPTERVHLHEINANQNNGDTIHIHHGWVSWGHFFANVRILFSDKYLLLDNQTLLKTDDKNSLTFILNWKIVPNPFNRMINSEDRLLINYWSQTKDFLLKEIFPKVKNDAWEYNTKYDPASCSWLNENKYLFLLKDMFSMEHDEH